MLRESNAKGSFELSGVAATRGEIVCARYFVNYLHSSVNPLLLGWSQCSPLLGPIAGPYMVGEWSTAHRFGACYSVFYYCWKLISYAIIYLKLLNASLSLKKNPHFCAITWFSCDGCCSKCLIKEVPSWAIVPINISFIFISSCFFSSKVAVTIKMFNKKCFLSCCLYV